MVPITVPYTRVLVRMCSFMISPQMVPVLLERICEIKALV